MPDPKRAVAFTFDLSLVSQASSPSFQANPTLATGDVKISIDEGAFADLATLPTVTPAAGRNVKVALSAGEMTGDRIVIQFVDAAGAEWHECLVTISTTAVTVDDLVRSTTPANTLDVSATGEAGLDFNNILSTGVATLNGLTITNNLLVSGNSTVTGTTTHTGAVSFGSTFATTGTTTFNALTVTNATTLSGAVSLGSTLGVTGTTTLAALTTTGTATFNALTVSNATTLTGAVSLGSTLGVTGTTTFAAVTTTGTVTMNALTVSNATTLTGAVSLGSTLGVTGTTTFAAINTGAIAATTLATSGTTTLNALTVTNNFTVSGNWLTTGTTTWTGAVTASAGIVNTYPVGAYYPSQVVDSGTAQAATGTTLQLRAAAAFADSELIGATIVIRSATAGAGQRRVITAYTSATDTATVDTWTTTPTGTIVYDIFGTAPAAASGTLPAVNVTQWLGTAVTAATAGIPDANVKNVNNVAAATPGAAGGLFIAGSNAATTIAGLTTGALVCTTITASGAVAFQSTFGVTGTVTFSTDFIITRDVICNRNLQVGGSLTFTGATTFTGAITATNAANDIRGVKLTSDGLALVTAWTVAITGTVSGNATAAQATAIQTDTDDIQTRLPAALVGGRMDASVGALAAGVIVAASFTAGAIDAAALATDAANEIADALLDRADAIEVGLTLRQFCRLADAALAGKMSGGGTATETFRNAVADSKNRIVATVDSSGNRTAITYDTSS